MKKRIWNEILKLIGLDKNYVEKQIETTKIKLNDFYIGYQHFVILELIGDDLIVFNKIISLIVEKQLNIYWFASYRLLEDSQDLLQFNKNETLFVLIG